MANGVRSTLQAANQISFEAYSLCCFELVSLHVVEEQGRFASNRQMLVLVAVVVVPDS